MAWAKTEKNLWNAIRYVAGIPRSLYFNFRCLHFSQAIKLPIIVSHKTAFKHLTGKIILENPKTFSVKIGFGTTQAIDFKYERAVIDLQGTWVIKGECKVGAGSRLSIRGELITGNNFNITARTTIICHKKIEFGENNLISWDNLFMDTDQHRILDENGRIINNDKAIIFEDNIWVGCRCTIMKGSKVSDNTVVGAGSFVRGKYKKTNVILTGNPAIIAKEGVSWN